MVTKQKKFKKDEEIGPVITPTPQILDDQTPLDKPIKPIQDLGDFDKRLPAGTKRSVRILQSRLGESNPILITNVETNEVIGSYDEINIEGESSLCHDKEKECGTSKMHGSISIITKGSILIKKEKE